MAGNLIDEIASSFSAEVVSPSLLTFCPSRVTLRYPRNDLVAFRVIFIELKRLNIAQRWLKCSSTDSENMTISLMNAQANPWNSLSILSI